MYYIYFKLIHITAVIMFLGNIYTGLFWMHSAVKTKDLKIISHTIKNLIKSDRYFTIPGVIIITAFGLLAAIYGHFPIIRSGWILWSIILFSISGIVFSFKLAPLQKKILLLSENQETNTNFDWINFNKTLKSWDTWGLIAILTPITALIMMILKIPQ